MKCEDLKFNLSIYSDDILTNEERETLETHLAACPLCRQNLAEMQEIRNSLRVMTRPAIPAHVLNKVKTAVAAEIETGNPSPQFYVFNESLGESLRRKLMPFGVGAFATLALAVMLLWSLTPSMNTSPQMADTTRESPYSFDPVMVTDPEQRANDFELTPSQYASTRVSVAGESPSVNPQGALVALTKSLMRGEMKDEEVVVVADVFGDGLAQITEVVEPSKNRLAVYELNKALATDPHYAPFVPADLDRRSNSVRVILKIQTVNVQTNLNSH